MPVFTALSHGVLSIEADVWLNPKDDRLYVRTVSNAKHSSADPSRAQVSHNVVSLTRARTFRRLYIDQLVDVLSRANVHDEETAFFDKTDYWTTENEREERRRWTRCAGTGCAPDLVLTRARLQLLRRQPDADSATC